MSKKKLLELFLRNRKNLSLFDDTISTCNDMTTWRNHVRLSPLMINNPQHNLRPLILQMRPIQINLNPKPTLPILFRPLQFMRFRVELIELAHDIRRIDIWQPLLIMQDVIVKTETYRLWSVVQALVERWVLPEGVTVTEDSLWGLFYHLDLKGNLPRSFVGVSGSWDSSQCPINRIGTCFFSPGA